LETELIILKTVNYGESSLILNCLSPEIGRLSILAKGAKKISKKNFPQIGLFRTYKVILSPSKQGDMYHLKSLEMLTQNDRLASTPSLLEFSGSISRFSLSGNFENVPCPVFYHALNDCLQKIETNIIPINAWICRLVTTYLMEQGLFPHIKISEQQRTIINKLIDKKSEGLETLDLKEDQWSSLKNWILKTALFAEINLPNTPCFTCC